MHYFILILENNSPACSGDLSQPLEIGRQQATEPLLQIQTSAGAPARLAIAPFDETRIGRRQLLIEPQVDGSFKLTNLSGTVRLELADGSPLEPKATQYVGLPISVLFPAGRTVTLSMERPEERLNSLGEATVAPGQSADVFSSTSLKSNDVANADAPEHLVQALQVTMDVFQTAHSETSLYTAAIQGAIQLAHFDRAQVLTSESGDWNPVDFGRPENIAWPVSQTVLRQLTQEKRTFWESAIHSTTEAASLLEVDAVIAAPILNPQGDVIGALYCDRRQKPGSNQRAISRLDARLIELLACGVASGLARMEQEETAQKLRSQFEQFFTPELARELERHPDLLEGRDADVSVLFCDIRGFSRISERIGAKGTFEWINDVMGVLSECVTKHQGVLVDYIGDELMAMWGAPRPQEEHAILACRAALEMLDQLPELNNRWEAVVGETMDLGIGINSGPVRAGNAGSKRKFKYSPLGNAVNLASRVQGATKYLKTRLLVTGATADQLAGEFSKRRLANVRVVNIEGAVSLWELSASSDGKEAILHERYDKALVAFESQEFRQSARELAEILGEWPNDGPSLVLLKRTVNALVDGPTPNHPLWTLGGK